MGEAIGIGTGIATGIATVIGIGIATVIATVTVTVIVIVTGIEGVSGIVAGVDVRAFGECERGVEIGEGEAPLLHIGVV